MTILIWSYQGGNLIHLLFMKTFVLDIFIQYIQRITFTIFFIKINFPIQYTAPKTMMLWEPLFIVFLWKFISSSEFERRFLGAYENCINSYYSSSDSLVCSINQCSFRLLCYLSLNISFIKTKKSFRKLQGPICYSDEF